jgi:hypothetical protein
MNALRLIAGFTGLVVLVSLPAAAQDKAGKVTLRTVKYAGLAETVTQNRGKVIVVDLWGFF